MSRFADPTATERMSLGSCQCPGTPHTEDYLELRSQVGTEDAVAISRASSNLDILELLLVSWNIQDKTGTVPPVDREHIALLFGDLFDTFETWLTEHVQLRAVPLPNGSAAPSASSTGASGSRTQKPRKGNSSTTSSWPPAAGVTTTSGTPRLSS